MGRKPTGKPTGRPPKDFDPKTFEGLCSIQCSNTEIYAVLDGQEDSVKSWVKRHYGIDFNEAKKRFSEGGKASLRRKQSRLADRNAAMAIWLGKNWLGQTDGVQTPEVMMEMMKLLLDRTRDPLNKAIPDATNTPSD